MVKGSSSMWMGMYMRGSGSMIKQTGMEYIDTLMEPYMKENGKMTCNMEKELRSGQMGQSMREIMHLGESMVLVLIYGVMDQLILVIGKKTRSAELASTVG